MPSTASVKKKAASRPAPFMRSIAKIGGSATGKCKRRGNKEYYAELGRKAAAAKKAKAALAATTPPIK